MATQNQAAKEIVAVLSEWRNIYGIQKLSNVLSVIGALYSIISILRMYVFGILVIKHSNMQSAISLVPMQALRVRRLQYEILCANFVLQATNAQGLGTRLVSYSIEGWWGITWIDALAKYTLDCAVHIVISSDLYLMVGACGDVYLKVEILTSCCYWDNAPNRLISHEYPCNCMATHLIYLGKYVLR